MYDIIGMLLLLVAGFHVVVLLYFLWVYFTGSLTSIGYGFGFGGDKYVKPFITWFVKNKC